MSDLHCLTLSPDLDLGDSQSLCLCLAYQGLLGLAVIYIDLCVNGSPGLSLQFELCPTQDQLQLLGTVLAEF